MVLVVESSLEHAVIVAAIATAKPIAAILAPLVLLVLISLLSLVVDRRRSSAIISSDMGHSEPDEHRMGRMTNKFENAVDLLRRPIRTRGPNEYPA